MGTVYQRQVRVCVICHRRLDTTAARLACTTAGHAIETRAQSIWWIRYHRDGACRTESSHSRDRQVAEALVAQRDTARVLGSPQSSPPRPPADSSPPGVLTFDAAADDLLTEYRISGKRLLRTVQLRIRKHLAPAFGATVMPAITPVRVRQYVLARQAAGASNASINRDLITLKRMFSLALQAGLLTTRPYVALLREQNVRRGFFEPGQLAAIRQHLPPHLRGIATFAFITGWRTPSEILPLEWRQIDWAAGEVRLDPGTTKNGDGRVFPFTAALRTVLADQRRLADRLQTEVGVTAQYVFCQVAGARTGQRISLSTYWRQWQRARVAAGCPDRIPHDFRRTAVRNLVRAGVPERVAMQLSGHKTRAVFERYNITSPNDLRDAAARLDLYASTQA